MRNRALVSWVIIAAAVLFIVMKLGQSGETMPEPKPIAVQYGGTSGDPEDTEAAPAPESTAPAESASTDDTGSKVIASDGYLGCPDRETYSRLVEFATQKDQEAFATLASSGGCIPLKAGEVVYLDEVPFMAGDIKVRRKGDVDGLWTAVEAVQ